MKLKTRYDTQITPANSVCGLFDSLDFSRLTAGALQHDEMERFVEHCEQCDECSAALWKFRKAQIAALEDEDASIREPELVYSTLQRSSDQNKRIFNRSIALLDELDTP